MTPVQAEKTACRKLTLLRLIPEIGDVSMLCKVVGYDRHQVYQIRRSLRLYGVGGLLDQLPGPTHLNWVSDAIEKVILEHCLEHPAIGAQRRHQASALHDPAAPAQSNGFTECFHRTLLGELAA